MIRKYARKSAQMSVDAEDVQIFFDGCVEGQGIWCEKAERQTHDRQVMKYQPICGRLR